MTGENLLDENVQPPANGTDKFEWLENYSVKITGVGTGIQAIDEVAGGFRPGQLISVYGPAEQINLSLLFHIAMFAALKQEKEVDYFISQSEIRGNFNKLFKCLNDDKRKEIENEILAPKKNSRRPILRVPEVELGDPSNHSWKDYVASAKENPPDVLLIDGVENLEMLLEETNLAQQFKGLASTLLIPIIAQAPINKRKDGWYTRDSVRLRSDFEHCTDIGIGLIPDYVCDHYENGKPSGRYFILETVVWASGQSAYGSFAAGFKLQFTDRDLRFQSEP